MNLNMARIMDAVTTAITRPMNPGAMELGATVPFIRLAKVPVYRTKSAATTTCQRVIFMVI